MRGFYTAPVIDPATPDELAAVYLRGRDVPCPGCGYNRHDGTTAACPECTAKVALSVQPKSATVLLSAQRARVIAACLLVIALVLMIESLGATFIYARAIAMSGGWSSTFGQWMIAAIICLLVSCFMTPLAINTLRTISHCDSGTRNARRITILTIALAIGLVPGAAMTAWLRIQSAIPGLFP